MKRLVRLVARITRGWEPWVAPCALGCSMFIGAVALAQLVSG